MTQNTKRKDFSVRKFWVETGNLWISVKFRYDWGKNPEFMMMSLMNIFLIVLCIRKFLWWVHYFSTNSSFFSFFYLQAIESLDSEHHRKSFELFCSKLDLKSRLMCNLARLSQNSKTLHLFLINLLSREWIKKKLLKKD